MQLTPRYTRVRDLALVLIGVVTPVGILAVNASAFVMQHLAEFRWFLAGAALVSSLLLNGLVAMSGIRYSQRNAPLLYAEYRKVVWASAAVLVAVTSYLAAYFTYLGLADPRQLPNRFGIIGSLWALLTPFAITYVDRRFLRRREVRAEKDEQEDREAAHPGRPRASQRRT